MIDVDVWCVASVWKALSVSALYRPLDGSTEFCIGILIPDSVSLRRTTGYRTLSYQPTNYQFEIAAILHIFNPCFVTPIRMKEFQRASYPPNLLNSQLFLSDAYRVLPFFVLANHSCRI